MHLLQWNRETGPREAVPFIPGSPAYEESVRQAKAAWIRERTAAGIPLDDPLQVKVQTYQTEKFA